MGAFRTIRSMQRVARPDLLVLQLIAQLIFLNVASSLPPEYCSNPVYAGVPIVSLTSSSIVTAPLPATHYWWVCYPSFSYAGSSNLGIFTHQLLTLRNQQGVIVAATRQMFA